MRILVTGGRDNWDYQLVSDTLSQYKKFNVVLLHGGAKGIDTLCANFAREAGWQVEVYRADWTRGPAAGPERNERMLHWGHPDLVVAFPGGRGTADMVRRALAAKVPVLFAHEGTELKSEPVESQEEV